MAILKVFHFFKASKRWARLYDGRKDGVKYRGDKGEDWHTSR